MSTFAHIYCNQQHLLILLIKYEDLFGIILWSWDSPLLYSDSKQNSTPQQVNHTLYVDYILKHFWGNRIHLISNWFIYFFSWKRLTPSKSGKIVRSVMHSSNNARYMSTLGTCLIENDSPAHEYGITWKKWQDNLLIQEKVCLFILQLQTTKDVSYHTN